MRDGGDDPEHDPEYTRLANPNPNPDPNPNPNPNPNQGRPLRGGGPILR